MKNVIDEDLLGDEEVDVEVGIFEMDGREMWCEDGGWAEVAQDCGP